MQQNDDIFDDFGSILCARPKVHKTPHIPRGPKYTKPRVYRVFFQYGVHAAIRNFCPEAFYVRHLFSYHVVNSHKKGPGTDQFY